MSTGLSIAVYAALACAVVLVAAAMIRSRRGGRSLLLTALQGIAALFAVNLVGMVSGVTVALNWYTLATGVVLGTPGIIGILLLDFLFAT